MFDPQSTNHGNAKNDNDSGWRTSAINADTTIAAPAPQQPAPTSAPAIPHQLRRHSVTVAEMHFHSFDNKNQHQYHFNHNELDHILASFPSSWSSTSSSSMASSFNNQQQRHPSLFDNSNTTASPTPAFFSPSFLDALKHEDNNPFQVFPPITTNTAATPTAASRDQVNNNGELMLQDFIIPTTVNSSASQAALPSLHSSFYNLNNDDWPLQRQQNNKPTSPTSILSNNTPAFYHPSIPEEDTLVKEEDLNQETAASFKLDTTFPITPPESNEDLKPFIQHYLSSFDNERKITILTSKVAQKSYGTEKRFLCPPPLTILSGSSPWFIHGKEPKIQVQIKGENQSVQNGIIDWQSSEVAGQNAGMTGTCVAKHLHINDSTVNSSGSNDDDKRKRVQIQVNILMGGAEGNEDENKAVNTHLCTFYSRGIKVISKPSKKRQSVKNMELCIHHGSIISLFNRIRSQTVSTKYLGVLSMETEDNSDSMNTTCFVARTNKWDPFVIWLVDLSRSTLKDSSPPSLSQDAMNRKFPPPPAIALQQREQQDPIAIHYNQPVVLQCVNTGLVSPIMIIRKVDKGSQVLGGNQFISSGIDSQNNASVGLGGECGDEALGDPVSQLHKIAFQIVTDPSLASEYNFQYHGQLQQQLPPMSEWSLPHLTEPQSTYLACLEDVVGMHKTTSERYFISTLQQQHQQYLLTQQEKEQASLNRMAASAANNSNNSPNAPLSGRRRRVSCDVTTVSNNGSSLGSGLSINSTSNNSNSLQYYHHPYDHYRRRVNSLNDGALLSTSVSANSLVAGRGAGRQYHRRNSAALSTPSAAAAITNTANTMNPQADKTYLNNGACWTEDVSDASIWTIVGTDYITYKFCAPNTATDYSNVCTPFPMLTSYTCAMIDSSSNSSNSSSNSKKHLITLHGENFTKDLSIWFGDVQSPSIEYKSKETIICMIPTTQELKYSSTCLNQGDNSYKIPILFIRDGVIYNTDQYYQFQ